MVRFIQFALGVGLVAGLAQPVFSDDPPPNQKKEDKKPTPPPAPGNPSAPGKQTPADQRIEHQKTRLEQRNKEIDRRLNKQKK